MIQVEERELRFFKNEEILQEISDSIRKNNIKIIGIPEGDEKEKEAESLLKGIIIENFPNLGKEGDLQVYEPVDPQITSIQKDLLEGKNSKTGRS